MPERVGLLGLTLVLALGAATAAQEVSPEASPPDPADDMAFLLPAEVAGMTVTKSNASPDEFTDYFGSDEFLRILLSPFDKGPADMLLGYGWAEGDVSVSMFAIRVEGVPGEDVAEGFIPAFAGASDATLPPHVMITTEDIGGEWVRTIRNSEQPDGVAIFYSVGEVMFIIQVTGEDSDETVAGILDQLP